MKFVQLLATNILFSKTFMCIRLESIPDPPCCTWLRICWVYRRAGDFCTCEYLRNLDFSVTPNFRFLFPFCRPIRLFSACQLYCSNCLTVFLVFQNADHGRPADSFPAARSAGQLSACRLPLPTPSGRWSAGQPHPTPGQV